MSPVAVVMNVCSYTCAPAVCLYGVDRDSYISLLPYNSRQDVLLVLSAWHCQ